MIDDNLFVGRDRHDDVVDGLEKLLVRARIAQPLGGHARRHALDNGLEQRVSPPGEARCPGFLVVERRGPRLRRWRGK